MFHLLYSCPTPLINPFFATMRLINVVLVSILVIIGLIIVWILLPTTLKYHKEITLGNKFIDNIKKYHERNGRLPDENQWDSLAKLNPLKPYETFYPEYRRLDSNNFELTYIEGFDPPYLQYDTKTNKWVKK